MQLCYDVSVCLYFVQQNSVLELKPGSDLYNNQS